MAETVRLSTAVADRYVIERELGAGGMATVYLAEDLKHKRKVALKVLRPELAAVLGAERFVQEITTTAALQHPHILPLFDSGTADGFLYYVMPYIEGETLRDKLNREHQIGIAEAVRITTEVADALDYAHRHGVIHRDIKPENILLHDGRPMVADFGIALALSAAAGGRMTETGLSLGTPHYMSPEQATAEKEITARSDVYSLGSVLFEMLAGQPPHLGGSAQQIIMKIIAEPVPAVTALRKSVPPNVAAAVSKALEKLPADRFESARRFAEALANPSFVHGTPGAGGAAPVGPRNRWTRIVLAVGLGALAISGWAMAFFGRSHQRAGTLDLNIALPDSAPLSLVGTGTLGTDRRALALSPDGRTLIYVGRTGGSDRLFRRDLGDFRVTPIAGTDGAYYPFFSPDGHWIGYFVGSELRKVPIEGGAPVTLALLAESVGADWGPDDRILVAGREGRLLGWVPASGGPIELVPDPMRMGRTFPSLLPGGRYALVCTFNHGISLLAVVDLRTGRVDALTTDGPVAADSADPATLIPSTDAVYVPTGYVAFSDLAGLQRIQFDPVTRRVGSRVGDLVAGLAKGGYGSQYTVGADGTLVYAPGEDADRGAFVWVSRDGALDSLGFAAQSYGTFALSPDRHRLAALVNAPAGPPELWVYDLERRTESKVLLRGAPYEVRWWPDGRSVVFAEQSTRPPFRVVTIRQLVESAGERDTLGVEWEVTDVLRDSSQAVGTLGFGHGSWFFPLTKDAKPEVLDSFPTAWGPTYSPDGRWIAYTSNESGRYEIYVTDARRRGARQKVSLDGGEEPLWSPRGGELIYRWGQEWLALSTPTGSATSFGRPRVILRGPYVNVFERSHDISLDGRRHLLVLGPSAQTTTRLNVILNWSSAAVAGARQ